MIVWKVIDKDAPISIIKDWCVLLYSKKLDSDDDFPGHPYHLSNPHYVVHHWDAIVRDYSHWTYVQRPDMKDEG